MKTLCPAEEILADYMAECLSPDDRNKIEAHLSDCDICLENFMVGSSLSSRAASSEGEHVPAYVTQAAVSLVNALNTGPYDLLRKKAGIFVREAYSKISDYLEPVFLKDNLVLVRGGNAAYQDCVRVRKNFSGMNTEIEMEKMGEDNANIRVTRTDDTEENMNIRVTLKKGDREISSLRLDEDYILFQDIPFDSYHLVFIRQSREIGTYAFELRGNPSHGKA